MYNIKLQTNQLFRTFKPYDVADFIAVELMSGSYYVYKNRYGATQTIISKGMFKNMKSKSKRPIILHFSYIELPKWVMSEEMRK